MPKGTLRPSQQRFSHDGMGPVLLEFMCPWWGSKPDPEVIKLFSSSAKLGMKFQTADKC